MNRLRREGWAERQGKGSHVLFTKPGQPNISVPRHPGDIKRGLLRGGQRPAGVQATPGAGGMI
jgi:predicted RNA binding protein YcfA (HicA-like mRNA interferase family)